jgi:prevent-host-death family protein
MKLLDKREAIASLADYVDQVDKGAIVVTVEGKPVAVLTTLKDTDLESVSLSTNSKFISIIERARQRYKREGGLSSEEVQRLFQNNTGP